MYKANKRLQDVFAHAAALQQNGRLRNTIYCYKQYIYILNQDDTVLIRFHLRPSEVSFSHPIAFHANDYDSGMFYEEDGCIHFVVENEGYKRIKRCGSPEYTPKYIHKLFCQKTEKVSEKNQVDVEESLIELLDESLTHIEFSAKQGNLKIVQRNIYTGSLISIGAKEQKGGLLCPAELKDFKPIGMRTRDFLALFSFTPRVSLCFGNPDFVWCENKDRKTPYKGIIGLCKYDELRG